VVTFWDLLVGVVVAFQFYTHMCVLEAIMCDVSRRVLAFLMRAFTSWQHTSCPVSCRSSGQSAACSAVVGCDCL
jgi:hypothetical protein